MGASALAALALIACGTDEVPKPVATNHVDLPKSYEFRPVVITVPVGTTVMWTNSDNFTHTVRIIDMGNRVIGTMSPGQSLSFTFTKPGTYHYDCSLHPQNMHGIVTVTEQSSASTDAQPDRDRLVVIPAA